MNWPYDDLPEPVMRADEPTWRCPDGACECHPVVETGEDHELWIVLLASDGARMPGARCRVHENGRVVNEDMPNADETGRVRVSLPSIPVTLLVEWAPHDTPIEPRYPYRVRYCADLRTTVKEAGRRRLANLGFSAERSLEGNVCAFQRRYGYPETGNLADIDADLTLFHDHGCPPVIHEPEPQAVSLGEAALDDTQASSFAPSARKAKSEPDEPEARSPTPQDPVPKSPNQGSVKVASPGVEVELTVDWGHGSDGNSSSSFWLGPAGGFKSDDLKLVPVSVGVVDSPMVDRWATKMPNPCSVTAPTPTSVLTVLPAGPIEIRVDFDLQVTIGSFKRTVLAFRQFFLFSPDGEAFPIMFGFEEFTYVNAMGKPPIRVAGNGFRQRLGMHPLCRLVEKPPRKQPKSSSKPQDAAPRRKMSLYINAEMVDATDLFWDLHAQGFAEHYLHPALHGRPEHLRVLAWTTGKLPMIWFAVVPDAALETMDTDAALEKKQAAATATRKAEPSAADIVFFRPIAGFNSFHYTADLKGFEDKRHHSSSTLWMLARFLISPQPTATLDASGLDRLAQEAFSKQIPRPFVTDKKGQRKMPTTLRQPLHEIL